MSLILEVTPMVLYVSIEVPALAMRMIVEINPEEWSIPTEDMLLIAACIRWAFEKVRSKEVSMLAIGLYADVLFIKRVTDYRCEGHCAIAEVERISKSYIEVDYILVIKDVLRLRCELEVIDLAKEIRFAERNEKFVAFVEITIENPTPSSAASYIEVAAQIGFAAESDLEDINIFEFRRDLKERIARRKFYVPAQVILTISCLKTNFCITEILGSATARSAARGAASIAVVVRIGIRC